MTKAEKSAPEQLKEDCLQTGNCSKIIYLTKNNIYDFSEDGSQISNCATEEVQYCLTELIDAPQNKPFDVMPLLAIIISIVTLVYTSHYNKQLRSKSVNDDYWMRAVIFPNILTPLINIGNESPEYFRTSTDMIDFYNSYFLDQMNQLRDKILILQIVDISTYEKANNIIDALDDNVLNADNDKRYCEIFGEFSRELTSLLRNIQYEI